MSGAVICFGIRLAQVRYIEGLIWTVCNMDEFSADDRYTAQVFPDPKAPWIRVFRNGAMCLECLPLDELLAHPLVNLALREFADDQGAPFRSWYEEMARDD